MRSRTAVAAMVLVSAVQLVSGCGGGDEAGSTQATPVSYPGDFPVQGPAPASGAQFFAVSGLTQGTSYAASLAGPSTEPDFDLGVYRTLEPTPPNELCASSNTGNDGCTFTSPGTTVYVAVFNLGGA